MTRLAFNLGNARICAWVAFTVAATASFGCSNSVASGGSGGSGAGSGAASTSSTGSPTASTGSSSVPGACAPDCWSLAPSLPTGSGAHDLVVLDCNADGHLDIVVANSESSTISVLVGHGDGAFDFQKTFSAGPSPWMLATADFDENGVDDLAVANFIEGAHVLPGLGNCDFGDPVVIVGPDPLGEFSVGALGVGAADVDGDGHDDVAVDATGPNGNYIGFYWGKGDGTFEDVAYQDVGSQVTDILLVDLDADGHLDAAGATSWLNGSTGDPAYVHVLRGLGGRSLSPAADYPVDSEPGGLIAADFDGDGILDVATDSGLSFGPPSLSLLRGNGQGGFQAQVTFPSNTVTDGYNGQNGLAAGDIDGDGTADLLIAQGADNLVAVLRGGAANVFTPVETIAVDSIQDGASDWNPYYLALADLNEDGVLDLAATNYVGKVSLLLSSP